MESHALINNYTKDPPRPSQREGVLTNDTADNADYFSSEYTLPLGGPGWVLVFLIFSPSLNVHLIQLRRTESVDESARQTAVCDEGNIQVDGCPTNLITIRKLMHGQVFRNIDHHVNLLLMQ